MPRRCHGALGDPTARTSAFWNFLGRRAIAVRTPPWCDRGIRHQAITSTNVNLLLTGTLGTYFNEILTETQWLSCKLIYFRMSSAEYQPSCSGVIVLSGTIMPRRFLMTAVPDNSCHELFSLWKQKYIVSHIPSLHQFGCKSGATTRDNQYHHYQKNNLFWKKIFNSIAPWRCGCKD